MQYGFSHYETAPAKVNNNLHVSKCKRYLTSSSHLTSQQWHSWPLSPPRNSLPLTSVALCCPDFPSTYSLSLPNGSLRYCGSAGLGSMSFKLDSCSKHTPQETSSISVPSNIIFMLMTHSEVHHISQIWLLESKPIPNFQPDISIWKLLSQGS